ncbi:PilZ domain-containing protein [Paludibaculum fermentans]|uniref:PilZ domain-containing protein n=1 Tax=Paludibaculum fermentans TaxID=1473598 RepID=A0A7S7NKK9_PALFE|nr:PilZ domain-containing protein [Paludibaculum fermentans]QOY85355.1 PilZ domain-containing protein [Paludibaculum fermentans]
MAAKNEERRHVRHPLPGKVKVHWRTVEGHSFHSPAKCLNISRGGIRLELERAIPVGTLVNLECLQFRIAGVAHVRHCVAKGMGFVVGVEFGGGLQWTESE